MLRENNACTAGDGLDVWRQVSYQQAAHPLIQTQPRPQRAADAQPQELPLGAILFLSGVSPVLDARKLYARAEGVEGFMSELVHGEEIYFLSAKQV